MKAKFSAEKIMISDKLLNTICTVSLAQSIQSSFLQIISKLDKISTHLKSKITFPMCGIH